MPTNPQFSFRIQNVAITKCFLWQTWNTQCNHQHFDASHLSITKFEIHWPVAIRCTSNSNKDKFEAKWVILVNHLLRKAEKRLKIKLQIFSSTCYRLDAYVTLSRCGIQLCHLLHGKVPFPQLRVAEICLRLGLDSQNFLFSFLDMLTTCKTMHKSFVSGTKCLQWNEIYIF